MAIRIKNLLFLLYFISLGFYTLYNPNGILPFCLIFSIIISINLLSNKFSDIIIPSFSIIDLSLLIFLLTSLLSVLLNINTSLNYNHLFSHFIVIILYYFLIRIFLNTNKYLIINNLILTYAYYAFFTIFITVLLDQSLLVFNINIANYLPMETSNTLVGVGFFTRARGFFVEPTDLALGINSIGPLVIFHFSNKRNNNFYFILFMYLFILLLTRSTAGFIELFFGLLICFLDLLSRLNKQSKIKLIISFKKIRSIFAVLFLSLFFYLLFLEPILTAYEEATKKLNISDSGRNDVRVEFWDNTFKLFISSNKFFTGFGTGFTTLNQKTFNWYLTVLVENGILGLLSILFVIIFSFLKIYKIQNNIRYAFYISFSSVTLHLTTQTGFYYPFLWLILVMIQLNWNSQKQL